MFPSQASHGFCVPRPPCPLPFLFEYFYTQFKTPEAGKLPMTITEYILKVFHIHVPVSHNLLAMFLQDIQAKCIFPSQPQAPNFLYFTLVNAMRRHDWPWA